MFSVYQIVISLLLIAFTYVAYAFSVVLNARKKLNWIPAAPRVPILGSIFEFHGNTETLNDFTRLTNNPSKLSYMEIVTDWGIIVKDYKFMEFVLSSSTLLKKGHAYKFFIPWLSTGLLTSVGTKWKQRRRVTTPAFHFSILEQFVDVFESNGKVWIQKLYDEAVDKESVDMYPYVTDCVVDIISESAMGVCINTQQNQNQDYAFAVKDFCKIATARTISSWKRYDVLFWFTEEYRKQQKNIKTLHDFSNSVIEEKKRELQNKNENKQEDDLGRKRKLALLDLLLNSTIEGQRLRQEDIREEVDTFMFGGHDTTASGISSALFMLANHPEIQRQAREEQKKIYGPDRDAPTSYQDLQEMKYLEMVIKETLRLLPPVPIVARLLGEDVEYEGHTIPKGTTLSLFLHGINRDPDFHESPEEFKPERFLGSSKYPYSFVPFSAGPRNCIGQKFAMLEMKSMISKMLRHFELYPTNPPHKLALVNEVVTKSSNGVKIMLKKHDWSE